MAEKKANSDKLLDELARKAAEVSVLRQVSLEINSTLNRDEIFDIVLRTMDELFDFHHSIILLLEDSGETLRVVASRGYEGQALGAEVAVGTGVIGMVAKRRRLMRLSNMSRQRAYASTIRRQMEQAGRVQELDKVVQVPGLANAESQIAIPLMIKDTLIAVFSVESSQQRTFSESDEILVTIVANQAASAIQNARSYMLAEERLRELNKANDALAQLNESLEERVRQRTRELSNTLRELTETQNQLVLREEMASLGNLVAGIAHEINSPIGAVNSAADVSQRCIAKIESVLAPQSDEEFKKPLALLRDSVEVTLTAGERIDTLVKSLKNFARLDKAEFQRFDLHDGLDSTLTLIQSELHGRIAIVKEYESIPQIYCSPAQINQVFMSILLNAAEAIEDTGTIRIKTFLEDDHIHVQISDTGKGIPPEKLEKIFDFGFSRDRSRVKMQVGLSTSYSIVQKHSGDIRVESTVGSGSRFTVVLPIDQPIIDK